MLVAVFRAEQRGIHVVVQTYALGFTGGIMELTRTAHSGDFCFGFSSQECPQVTHLLGANKEGCHQKC